MTTENGLSAADVAAVTGNNGGFGNWGDGSFWIIVLFLFALMGNWGGNGFGGNGGGAQFASMTDTGNAFSKAAGSSNGLDLPDINNLNLSSGQSEDDSVTFGSDGEVLSDNTDFISSALKYTDDNAGNIQDASLMAKAISSILSEET